MTGTHTGYDLSDHPQVAPTRSSCGISLPSTAPVSEGYTPRAGWHTHPVVNKILPLDCPKGVPGQTVGSPGPSTEDKDWADIAQTDYYAMERDRVWR